MVFSDGNVLVNVVLARWYGGCWTQMCCSVSSVVCLYGQKTLLVIVRKTLEVGRSKQGLSPLLYLTSLW